MAKDKEKTPTRAEKVAALVSQIKEKAPVEKTAAPAPAPKKFFGVFDADGYPTAFYCDAFHSDIPQAAIEITPAQHQEFIENEGRRKFKSGKVVEAEVKETPLTLDLVRTIRGGLLNASDWTQLADAPLTDEKKAEWAAYRQALRDIPESFKPGAPLTWPTKPA